MKEDFSVIFCAVADLVFTPEGLLLGFLMRKTAPSRVIATFCFVGAANWSPIDLVRSI